ncbi:MAG: hypothetical protein LBQ19_05440 [Synergistaceae bacterium]|jgi:hypothetical protein|nr:hypothetical protein [Synergistaceae bacterium]
MNKFAILTLFFILAAASPAAAATSGTAFEKLVDARTAVCTVEGESLGDIVLNARGRLAFIMVDRKLGEAMRDLNREKPLDGGLPEWLRFFGRNYSKKSGFTLFVVDIRASKPWTFDTGRLKIAGRVLEPEDILTGLLTDPQKEIRPGVTELPSGYEGYFSFLIPSSLLRAGEEIEISYGEDAVKLKTPGRNE